jgi:peptidoglycan hydrolase CwlO-like protein
MNIRNMLIIAVIVVLGAFGYKWFGGYGLKFGESEKRVKELETQFNDLQKQKDSSDQKIVQWHSKFDSIRGEDVRLKSEVSRLHKETTQAEIVAAKSKLQLDSARAKSEQLKSRIIEVEKNPANRTGDDLIQSLKNKLK